MRFKGRRVIVTGGASGIGLAAVQRFHAEGAHVALLDIDETAGRAAIERLNARGAVTFYRCDVADEASVAAVFGEIIRDGTGPSVLVNNAFRTHLVDPLDLSAEQMFTELSVNLMGPFYLSQRLCRHLIANGKSGAIVNVTSVAASLATGNQIAYSASKAGLAGLTRAMAIAFAPRNVRVNAIAPGPTATPAGKAVLEQPGVKQAMLSRVPLGRYSEPSEQASAIAFLASDDASFITGETLFVDGGRMVLNHVMGVKTSSDWSRSDTDDTI